MNAAQNNSATNPQPPNPPNLPQPLPPPQRPVYPDTSPTNTAAAPSSTPASLSAAVADAEAPTVSSASTNKGRSHPIPPPSNPRQNRAIGLVQGTYQHSDEQLTRGILVAEDGTKIDAVLLGRVISLVKNHLDLSQPHLWVVYPRTRQKDECLHLQIVGVWEPETLSSSTDEIEEEQTSGAAPQAPKTVTNELNIESGYFSIRGEVIFSDPTKAAIVVKIHQAAKKQEERSKFFKVQLSGQLPDKALGHFWDLQVQLIEDKLTIQRATDLGRISKKNLLRKGGKKSRGQSDYNAKRTFSDSSSRARGHHGDHGRPHIRKNPLPKPTPPSKMKEN